MMADPKQKFDSQSDKSASQPLTPKEAQADAEAQVDLMGNAAVDPRPLMKEDDDPIAEEIKSSNPE